MAHEYDVLAGKLLREQRILRGMSQEELASRIGVTFQQIQKYEKAVNRISASKMLEISEVLQSDLLVSLSAAAKINVSLAQEATKRESRIIRNFRNMNQLHQRTIEILCNLFTEKTEF